MTPREVATFLHVRPARVRAWIKSGELAAINTAPSCSRPRFIVLPHHLFAFERGRRAFVAAARKKGKARPLVPGCPDYFPEL
jgi:hypothetical protein